MPTSNRSNVHYVYQSEPENAPEAMSPDVYSTQTILYTATYITDMANSVRVWLVEVGR